MMSLKSFVYNTETLIITGLNIYWYEKQINQAMNQPTITMFCLSVLISMDEGSIMSAL